MLVAWLPRAEGEGGREEPGTNGQVAVALGGYSAIVCHINHEVTKHLRMGRLYYARYIFLKLLQAIMADYYFTELKSKGQQTTVSRGWGTGNNHSPLAFSSRNTAPGDIASLALSLLTFGYICTCSMTRTPGFLLLRTLVISEVHRIIGSASHIKVPHPVTSVKSLWPWK